MERLNIGIIGCGRISDLHYLGYENNPQAVIYAVCDTDTDVAMRRQKEWKAEKAFTDYKELLNDPNVHAVEILTPHTLHEPMVIAAARAGKHLAVQKPMTINLGSADRMLAEVKSAGVQFKISDNYLFYPPIVLAKKMIDQGDIGEPSNLRMKFISAEGGGWDVPASAWHWRMQENAAGRPMQTFDHGHHLWATAWYLLGDIDRVVSWIDSADGVVDCPSVVMWKHSSGRKYGMCEYCHSSELHIPSRYYANDEWIEITGSRGVIMIHRCTGNINDGPAVSLFNAKGWRQYSDIESDWSAGFKDATRNFINVITGSEDPLLSGKQGRRILQLALAIQKSARVRREVFVEELDAALPFLYSWKKTRVEKKAHSEKKTILAKLGIGKRDARYAAEAKALTEKLIDRFNPAAIRGWQSEIGLVLLAEGEASEIQYTLTIKNESASLAEGKIPENAALVIKSPAGTWAAILLKKKRLETALLQGRMKLEGKAELGLKLRKAFDL